MCKQHILQWSLVQKNPFLRKNILQNQHWQTHSQYTSNSHEKLYFAPSHFISGPMFILCINSIWTCFSVIFSYFVWFQIDFNPLMPGRHFYLIFWAGSFSILEVLTSLYSLLFFRNSFI